MVARRITGRSDFNFPAWCLLACVVLFGVMLPNAAQAAADLEVTKTASNATPLANEIISYTIVLTNNGPDAATNVFLSDIIHSQLQNQNLTTVTQGTFNSGLDVWDVGTLASGASATLFLVVKIKNNTADGTVIPNVTSSLTLDQVDSNPANDVGSASVVVNGTAINLAVTKSVDIAAPSEGTSIVYTLTVTGDLTTGATGVLVNDLLPAGVTYASDDSGGSYNSGTGDWTIGALAANTSATLNIIATVDLGTTGTTISNTANLSSNEADSNTLNNRATQDITPTPAVPDILVLKSAQTISNPVDSGPNPKSIPGAIVLYTITITNQGGGAADADTVIITDPVPANTELFVGDIGGLPAGSPVAFIDGATPSGLIDLSFTNLGSTTDDIEFSSVGGAPYNYTPLPDVDDYDAGVTDLRLLLKGTFAASDGTNHPSFTIMFKVRLQ